MPEGEPPVEGIIAEDRVLASFNFLDEEDSDEDEEEEEEEEERPKWEDQSGASQFAKVEGTWGFGVVRSENAEISVAKNRTGIRLRF